MAVYVQAHRHLQAEDGNQEKTAQDQKRVVIFMVLYEADGGQYR